MQTYKITTILPVTMQPTVDNRQQSIYLKLLIFFIKDGLCYEEKNGPQFWKIDHLYNQRADGYLENKYLSAIEFFPQLQK